MRLLGLEERAVRGRERKREREDREEEISREKIRRVRKNIKEKKAAGLEGIPGKVWKYGGEEIEEWVWGFCNKIWKGEVWPQGWREGAIIPIVKKGEGKRVEDYRGVTLMPTLY